VAQNFWGSLMDHAVQIVASALARNIWSGWID
jgi:hypothetical protein